MLALDDVVREWIDRGVEPSIDSLKVVLERDSVDAGWRTDEELVILDDGRLNGTIFGAPALEEFDVEQREAAVVAVERLLVSRGELVAGDDGSAEVVGPVALVVSMLSSCDRQATVEARRSPDAAKFLVCRRRGDVCMIEEVLTTGLHHFVFVDRSGELDTVAEVVGTDADWTVPPAAAVEGAADDPVVDEAVDGLQSRATAAALVTRLSLEGIRSGMTEGPEVVTTYFAGPIGLVAVGGTDSDVSVGGLTEDQFRDHLAAILD